MAKMARRVAMGVAAMIAGGAGLATASDTRAAVVLRIENLSDMSPAEVRGAKALANALYDRIGVSLVWLARSEKTPDAYRNGIELRVTLLADERTELLLAQRHLSPTVLGLAPLDVPAVYIFCHRVTLTASRYRRPFEYILGQVLAHEVGHQLLPREGHSDTGIMRAHVDAAAYVVPGFTREQGKAIRARLMDTR